MAVDLTTGTYNEEGVFSKHNDDSDISETYNARENLCSLKNFRTVRIIKECLSEKSLVLEGHFSGDDKPAIVIVEKMPFNIKDLTKIFCSDSRLELKFRNNIYTNYHVYPASGFNGFDVKVIYPATEKDFKEFVDEPMQMVTESAEIYKSVVLPHFKEVSSEKSFSKSNPNATVICDAQDPQSDFVLLEDKPLNCTCSAKHIRAVCILQKNDILSLRDLMPMNVSLLSHIKEKCLIQLSDKYSIPPSKFLSYVCYPPVYFPFHVYFETIEKDITIPVEKAHHLETVISNLNLIPDYYKKVTLKYSLTEKDDLMKKIEEASSTCNQ